MQRFMLGVAAFNVIGGFAGLIARPHQQFMFAIFLFVGCIGVAWYWPKS